LHRESASLRGPSEGSYFSFFHRRSRCFPFAALGDALKPKSFAGLFGAAPSIALATLGLTIAANGKMYAATEARSMVAGALAFSLYTRLCSWLMLHRKLQGMPVTISALAFWLVCSISRHARIIFSIPAVRTAVAYWSSLKGHLLITPQLF
jgi:hypothetical protein